MGRKSWIHGPGVENFLLDLDIVVGTWNSKVQCCHYSQALVFNWKPPWVHGFANELWHPMELKENDVGQELKSRNCNLHNNWAINSWTLVVYHVHHWSAHCNQKSQSLNPTSKPFSFFLYFILFLAFYWNVHYEQWVYESWHLFVFNFFFPHFVESETCTTIKNLSLQLVLEPSTWWSCSFLSRSSTLSIYVLYLHNVQHAFVLFYYVKKLIKGLFNLGVGLLCLGFWSKVCCAFVLFYRFNARYGPFTIGVPKRNV